MDMSKFMDRLVHFRNSGMKGLDYLLRPPLKSWDSKQCEHSFTDIIKVQRIVDPFSLHDDWVVHIIP